ncbi:DUF1684 domain-containing protein [Jiangella endophytica]|uniref:DUF1684 domain-containing protein n=1 Tax=Jiangella endophytica TaxID=1623398 RepID=UPI000E357D92|nr:DUF1684 domain-containing protein [Jiangella endophytica]
MTQTTLLDEWTTWHAAREDDLRQPYGWLSLVAYQWLPAEPVRFPGLPGEWSASDAAARVTASAADALVVDGTRLDGTAELSVAESASHLWAEFGAAKVEVGLRGGRYALRVRDPQAPVRAAFVGVPAFDFDERWIVTGRFVPAAERHTVVVGSARTDLSHTQRVAGTVVFTLDGAAHMLTAIDGGDGALVLPFHDRTNGRETWTWRVLHAGPAGPDGAVTLDFNRAVNPPSSFTAYGTCPRPPAGSTLAVAVRAGERAPR